MQAVPGEVTGSDHGIYVDQLPNMDQLIAFGLRAVGAVATGYAVYKKLRSPHKVPDRAIAAAVGGFMAAELVDSLDDESSYPSY